MELNKCERPNAFALSEIETLLEYWEKNKTDAFVACGIAVEDGEEVVKKFGKRGHEVIFSCGGDDRRIVSVIVLAMHMNDRLRKHIFTAIDMYAATLDDKTVAEKVKELKSQFRKK